MSSRVESRACLLGPFPPHRGGISHYNTCLATALARRMSVSRFGFARLYPSLLFPGRTQFDHSASGFSADTQRVLDPIAVHRWWSGARHVIAQDPDLVVYQWWHPFFAAVYRATAQLVRRARPRARQVFVCHNVQPHEHTPVHRWLTRVGLGAADGALVHSRSDRDLLSACMPTLPSAVHPHPPYDRFAQTAVDAAAAREWLGVSGEVVLFFGYVRAYKGLAVLLQALAELRGSRDVTLVVAGEFYEDRGAHEATVARLGLDDSVIMHDRYIDNAEVGRYFAAADVVALPYVSASQSGISQLAYAFGVPVIASAVGGIPEAIDDGETGMLVPPNDASALARAIVEFFVDDRGPAMRQEIRRRARASATWDSLATAILDVAGLERAANDVAPSPPGRS